MNSTSEAILLDSINNIIHLKTGGGFIPDLGSGLSKKPHSVQWSVFLIIICLIFYFIVEVKEVNTNYVTKIPE